MEHSLGNAITIVHGKPVQYIIRSVELKPSSSDLMGRFPLAYVFEKTKPIKTGERFSFAVLIAGQLLEDESQGVKRNDHLEIIRIAFEMHRKEPLKDKFYLTHIEYNAYRKMTPLTSRELRHAILDFIYRINLEWPSFGVSYHDLYENIRAPKEEIQDWVSHLNESGFVTIRGWKRSERYGESTQSLRMNAARLSDAKSQVREGYSETISSFKNARTGEPNCVFIVHGHNEKIREEVAGFLAEHKLEPRVLHEQPDRGRTIIEKFTDYADVAYAVVLLTGDDIGGPIGTSQENLQRRARQNVIFELGYFIGKIGRQNVCALYERDVEILSDYSGVLYVPIDDEGKWRSKLARELEAAGLLLNSNNTV